MPRVQPYYAGEELHRLVEDQPGQQRYVGAARALQCLASAHHLVEAIPARPQARIVEAPRARATLVVIDRVLVMLRVLSKGHEGGHCGAPARRLRSQECWGRPELEAGSQHAPRQAAAGCSCQRQCTPPVPGSFVQR